MKCSLSYQNINVNIVNCLRTNLLDCSLELCSNYANLVDYQLSQIYNPNGSKSNLVLAKTKMEFMYKEAEVKTLYDLSRVKTRTDDGRVYMFVKRQTVSSTSYVGLIEKLYDLAHAEERITLSEYFEVWMKWRAEETATSPKTIRENRFLWNSFLRDDELVAVPLKSLKIRDYLAFFRRITKLRSLTRLRFNDIKSILNGILYLAVENEIIDRNCLKDINYKQFPYKAKTDNIAPYTEEERQMIIDYLSQKGDDFYSISILFAFHVVLRIGELKALRWDDIQGNCIYIQRFVNDKNQLIEDIKGHAKEGKRLMPLTDNAKLILEKVKVLNPDSEYIFIRNGQPLATVTFNRHLKRCCNALNIEYRSSHKLRFSTASIMYKNGIKDTELQRLLGHTTLTMTHHYLRDLTPEDETVSKMNRILG